MRNINFKPAATQNNMRYLYTLITLFTLTFTQAQETADYTALQVKPTCLDGMDVFYAYINNNMVIPAFEKDATLRISLSFVVERDGTLSTVKILKDPGYGLGEEAARVVRECPSKWSPGIQNGKKVRAQFVLPIVIKVEGEPKVPQGEEEPAVEDAEGQ